MDGAARDINIVKLGACPSEKAEKPCQFGTFIIAVFEEGCLYIHRYPVFNKVGNNIKAVQGYLIRMDEMGGDLQAFVPLLQLKILDLQIIEPKVVIIIKKIRIIRNGTGGQAKCLHMRDFLKTVNSVNHVGFVEKGISSGNHNLLDTR